MPVALSQTDENLRTQLISTSQFLLKVPQDIFLGRGGGASDPVQEMNEGKCCWDRVHNRCIKKIVQCSPRVVNRRAKILQAKPSGHHGNPTLVKALGSKEAWGVFRGHECRVTVIYCTQTHHKFKNLRSSSSPSTIINVYLCPRLLKLNSGITSCLMQLPHFQRLTARSSAAPTQIYKGKPLNLQYSVMTGAEKWHRLCLFELGWHNNDTAVIVSIFTILLIFKDVRHLSKYSPPFRKESFFM